ncbi:exonuclease SbcCD subunit D [Brevibacterium yomogidense]|uniref:exonuclease SbcCD subunit D n=1 Tax=Brevibacterium yomogidense TaxID=946573 RepID=UPI0018DF94B0|nr:exonuclease SbcCD subunit D [Brevibacterium yomogidense]
MRILHTSDWHLGRRLHGVDLTDAQRKFLDWLHTTVEERAIDVVLIAGDVYDRAIPHPDALGLWEYAVSGLLDRGVRIVASSGNHDSFVRLGLNRHHLDRAGVHLRTHLSDIVRPVRLAPDGSVLTDKDPRAAVSVHGIPYLEPSLVWERIRAAGRTHAAVLGAAMSRVVAHRDAHAPQDRLVVLAHAFVAGSVSSESERDVSLGGVGVTPASVFADADYAALGHVHRPQALSDRIRYSGSPLPFSFGEARFAKQVVEVEFAPAPGPDGLGTPLVTAHTVPEFRPVRTLRGTLRDVIAQASDHPDALVSAELTDPQRVPGAVDRLRSAFPGFIRMSWTELTRTTTVPGAGAGAGTAVLTDEEVFAGFHQTQRGGPPPDHATRRFSAALAQVHTGAGPAEGAV